MSGATIRRPLWDGVRAAAGLWLAAEWLDEAERARRLLEAWRPGSTAWRFADGDVLVFPAAVPMHCARAPGQVLCRQRELLASAPLQAAELAVLPAADLVLVSGAVADARRFADAAPIEAWRAIDLSGHALHETWALDVIPPAAALPDLAGRDVRGVLEGRAPERSAETRALIAAIAGRGDADGPGPRGRGAGGHGGGPADGLSDRVVGAARSALGRLITALGLGEPAFPTAGTGRPGGPGHGGVHARRRPSPPSRWRAALARLAMTSGLGRAIGHRQAAHLRRLMALFEHGQLDEALRHALPIDGAGGSEGQALGVPGRRDRLRLSTQVGGGLSIHVDEDVNAYLRRLYRESFHRLDREGRIDEAVFVLAELLNARQEAIDYLVKHDRAAAAAELALAWDLPSGLVIRLLMLAGDTHRALQVARRDGAFAQAVQLLEDGHPALATALRREWAQALVDAGDWLGAVDAIWPVEDARADAIAWLRQAEQGGVALSARALVMRAQRLPDTLEAYAERIDALADPAGPAPARTAMAQAMLAARGNAGGALRRLATYLLPAIAADAHGEDGVEASELQALLTLSRDPLLAADAPPRPVAARPAGTPLWSRTAPLVLDAPARGLHAVHDVAALPDGRYLVALGEPGAAVLDARGRVLQRYAAPAWRLVTADSGELALVVAKREQASRVARLDLVRHVVTELGLMPLQHHAPRLAPGGVGWTVVEDGRVLVLDTRAASRQLLWHLGDLPGPVVRADFYLRQESFIVLRGQTPEEWRFQLPERRRLPSRELASADAPASGGLDEWTWAHPTFGVLRPRLQREERGGPSVLRWAIGGRTYAVALEGGGGQDAHATLRLLEGGFVVGLHDASDSVYSFVPLEGGVVVARVCAPPGALDLLREQDGEVLMHDLEGRVLHLEFASGRARWLTMS